MEPLKVPAKYNRCGIKVKCLKCKWQLGDGKCHEEKEKVKGISKCEYKDKHRYNLIVCVPNTKDNRRMKIVETRDFESALEEMQIFRKELQVEGYHKSIEKTEKVVPTFINYAADYLDCLNGVNTP